MNAAGVARVVSLLTIAFGVFALARPEQMAHLANLQALNGDGWSDIGALYGGMPIAIGVVGLRAARKSSTDGPVVLLGLGVLWFGVAAGRIAAVWTTPLGPGVVSYANFAIEVSAGALLCWAGWRLGYQR